MVAGPLRVDVKILVIAVGVWAAPVEARSKLDGMTVGAGRSKVSKRGPRRPGIDSGK